MRKQRQALDEAAAGGAPALDVETEHGTGAAWQQAFGQFVVCMARKARIAHALHRVLPGQELCHRHRVGDVALHAQRQGLKPLQDVEGGGGGHAGTEIADALLARPRDERLRAELLGEREVMEAGVGFRQRGEALRRLPIEGAAIHHQTADDDAVAAQELRRRVHHEVRAELERLAEPRRGEGGIDEERHGGGMGGRGNGGNVQHFEAGVAQRLAEHQLRVRPHRRGEGFRRARINERRLDAKPRQRIFQEIVRTAIQGARRDDVIPRRANGGDGEMQRRLAAGHRDGANAALQRAHTLLEHRVGGIREARIHMAGAFDVEEPDRVVRIREHEGRALVDGRGTSARGGIRRLPGVQRQGVEAGAPGRTVLSVWHGLFGCERQRDGSRLGPAGGVGACVECQPASRPP